MIKQLLYLIVLSIVIVFFKTQFHHIINFAIYLHEHVTSVLAKVFSSDTTGQLIQAMLALILIPCAVGLVASGIYWAFKRSSLPKTMEIIWVTWLILLTTFTIGIH